MKTPLALLFLFALSCQAPSDAPAAGAPVPSYGGSHAESDARAIQVAEAVLVRMGGREAWAETRYLSWRFFDMRDHVWDRWSGDVRIESEDLVLLMNVNEGVGRAFRGGVEVTEEGELEELLELGHAWWVNDSYWMFMPYKLLDPGVVLADRGAGVLADGRPADELELHFHGVGLTPQNVYRVRVAVDTGLVEEWSFYPDETRTGQPAFTSPWAGWKPFGEIWLSTDKGRGLSWNVAVHDELPDRLFLDPSAPLP